MSGTGVAVAKYGLCTVSCGQEAKQRHLAKKDPILYFVAFDMLFLLHLFYSLDDKESFFFFFFFTPSPLPCHFSRLVSVCLFSTSVWMAKNLTKSFLQLFKHILYHE